MKSMLNLSITVCLSLLVSSLAYAVDFNSIITENSKAQNELHSQIKDTVNQVRLAVQAETGEKEKYLADTGNNNTINSPTDSSVLKFEKEKSYYRPSQGKSDKRLAQEFQDLE